MQVLDIMLPMSLKLGTVSSCFPSPVRVVGWHRRPAVNTDNNDGIDKY